MRMSFHGGDARSMRWPAVRILKSFMHGIGASGLFLSGQNRAPRIDPGSLSSDWQAVGDDIRRATVLYDAKSLAEK